MQLLDNLFSLTKQNNASDLHCGEGYKPYLRINGNLLEQENENVLSKEDVDSIATELIPERDPAQITDTDFSFTHGETRFRGHAYREQGHLNFAFRALPKVIPTPDSLGIPSALVDHLMQNSEGLFLVTGPTGSGKTTTIASLIDAFNQTRASHIITIEDPIEYIHESKKSLVKQREVGTDVETFSAALRSVLREDPDIIFIGEMRDMATMRLALRAAETGHLVFSTLHTAFTSQIPSRIISSFPAGEQAQIRTRLANSLRGALSQALIAKQDGSGRVAAYEVMIANHAIRNLIQEDKSQAIRDVIKTSRAEGMILLEDAVEALSNQGLI